MNPTEEALSTDNEHLTMDLMLLRRRYRELEQDNARLVEQRDAVLAIHQRMHVAAECCNHPLHQLEFQICRECCVDEDDEPRRACVDPANERSCWPCDTARALGVES